MEELREKYEQEKETLVKDRETLFQAHIEEMNEKTLEKLDVKQTELESLSSELSEVLKTRDKLEEELSVLKDQADRVKQELEAKLDEQKIITNNRLTISLKNKRFLSRELKRP